MSSESASGDPVVVLAERRAWEELQFYTLAHGGPELVHQLAVDAWTAQHADERTKPIALTFALVGLYLHLEKGFSGRQVQRAHMALAKRAGRWPELTLPVDRGIVTASHVMGFPPGTERDEAIRDWCASVWGEFLVDRPRIVALLESHGYRGCDEPLRP